LFTTFRTFRSEGFGANVLFQVTDRKTFRLSDFPISSPDFRDSVGLSWGPTMFVKDLLSRVDPGRRQQNFQARKTFLPFPEPVGA
jgi:hypothetical protein